MDNRIHKIHKEYVKRFGTKIIPPLNEICRNGDTSHPLNQIIVAWAKQLIPHAAKGLGMTESAFEKRLTQVRTENLFDFNCGVTSEDGWKTFQITMDGGFMIFLNEMFRVLATQFLIANGAKPVKDARRISLEDAAFEAEKLMKAYWSKDLTMLFNAGVKLETLTTDQIIYCGGLLDGIEGFAVAHEFGHIVIKLSTNIQVFMDQAERVAEIFVKELQSTGDLDKTKTEWLIQGYKEELLADYIGLKLLLMVKKNGQPCQVFACEGVTLFFLMWSMLDYFFEKTHKRKPPFGNHPPSLVRFALLKEEMVRNTPPEIGKALELDSISFHDLTNLILGKIFPPVASL